MKFKLAILLLVFTISGYTQQVLDKIVAVIDNEVILQSELEFQMGVYASQRQLDVNTPGLKEQILKSMIEEKLIYAQAELDSITVTEEEINQRIDYQINTFTQQYGSTANIEKIYGMSIDRIKRELRDDVRKGLMSQRLQEKKFGKVQASKREVEDFFTAYKDSIGTIPEKVNLYHIFQNPKAGEKLKKKFRDKAIALLDSIKAGKDFSELAKLYSDDPGSATQGGDLGFVKKGVFYPEFEEAAFKLNVGQISGVIESPVGFHIIQLIEKRGESIHCKHILVKIKADEKSDLQTIEFLTDVRDSIMKGLGTFQDYAKKYSEDKDTAPFGGELGTYYMSQLDKSLLDAVGKLKQGDIGYPKRLEYGSGSYGYHIVWLKSRVAQHKADLTEDYTEIKKLADENKKQKEYSKWIDSIKSKIFWEVRI